MIKAQLSFIEREFKEMHLEHLVALIRRISVLDKSGEAGRIGGEGICDKILTLIEEMEMNSDSTVTVMALFNAYNSIGSFRFIVGTKQSLEKAKCYWKKAIDVIKIRGA